MNRNHYFLAMAMLLASSFLCENVWGQCTPDTTATGLVSPDTLPTACPNQFYDVSITVNIPADTSFGLFTTPIDSVVLESVVGLPTGLSFECFPINCSVPGGSQGCVRIFGTPTDTGLFPLDILGSAYIPISPTPLTNNIPNAITIVVGLEAEAVSTEANCSANDGSATVVMKSGNAPFDFAWNDPQAQTDSVALGLAAGSYEVTVTDASGCVGVFDVNVSNTDGADISQQTEVGWVGCAEDEGGFINLNITGGQAPYSVLWSDGSSESMRDSLLSGGYTVTVTDDAGCATTETFQVDPPTPLLVSFPSSQDATCAGADDARVSALAGGGSGTLSYSWNTDPISMGPTIVDLAPGDYTVTVEDGIGCVKSSTITLTEPDSLSLNFEVNTVSTAGAGDGSVIATANGGTPPYAFDWEGLSDSSTLVGLNSGVYTVTVTDSNGCVFTDSIGVFNTSIELPPSIGTLKAYPNPARQYLQVELELKEPQSISLQLHDLQGRTLTQINWGKRARLNENINLDTLPNGLYLLTVQVGEQMVVRRIRVEE